MVSLSICLSTIYEDKNKIWKLFESLASIENIELNAIVQKAVEDTSYIKNGVKVYERKEKGLSKSRNLGLIVSSGKYVWIIDDDVEIKPSDVYKVLEEIDKNSVDVFIGKIRCSDKCGYYKNYKRKRQGRLGLLRVSSIEIIVKRSCFGREVCFDENMGLGTDYPSGEEALFLLAVYDHGYSFMYLDYDVIAHPCNISRKDLGITWKSEGILASKGIIARRFGGAMGLLLAFRWTYRAVRINKSIISGIKVLNGYKKI